MNFSCPMVIDLRSYLATNLPNFAATCLPPSGSVFPLGTNAITCTYTNARGVVTNFAFTITIADTKACLVQNQQSQNILSHSVVQVTN